jgi:hypothetical protein
MRCLEAGATTHAAIQAAHVTCICRQQAGRQAGWTPYMYAGRQVDPVHHIMVAQHAELSKHVLRACRLIT